MNTTKKFLNVLFLGFCMGFALVNMTSCDSDDIYDIRLANTLNEGEISIPNGTTTEIVIESGNGGYTVKSSDEKIATATVADNKLTITAKSVGNAKLTLTDNENKSFTLNIKVIVNDATIIIPDSKPIAAKNSTGFYVANEDWFGHDNGSINFFKTDGDITYRAYRAANKDKKLGTTTQFATIYGDNAYFVSKQGKRLVVSDAKTLKSKVEIEDLNGNDGRSFIGITPEKGYIATSKGVTIFDIKNLKVGQNIEGVSGEAGDMCTFGNRAFVLVAKKVTIINTTTDKLEKQIDGEYGCMTHGKDGNIWLGAGKKLIKLNPYTLETTEFDVTSVPIPGAGWAWRAARLCASQKENTLYWTSGTKVIKYNIDTKTLNDSFYTLGNDDAGVALEFYGSAIRIEPITDKVILLVKRKGWGSNGAFNWLHILKNTGALDKKITVKGSNGTTDAHNKDGYFWFPAMPFFQDVNTPEILVNQIIVEPNKRTAICLSDKIYDADNMATSIIKSITATDSKLAKLEVKNDSLIINSGEKLGKIMLTINANSNGKTTQKEVRLDIRNK